MSECTSKLLSSFLFFVLCVVAVLLLFGLFVRLALLFLHFDGLVLFWLVLVVCCSCLSFVLLGFVLLLVFAALQFVDALDLLQLLLSDLVELLAEARAIDSLIKYEIVPVLGTHLYADGSLLHRKSISWWEKWIGCDPECIVQHLVEELGQKVRARLQ